MTHHPIATTLLALALSSAAHAQHAVTMTMSPDTFTVRTEGPVPVAVVELFAGSGATFAAGTDGDLDWDNRITTLTGDGSFNVIATGTPLRLDRLPRHRHLVRWLLRCCPHRPRHGPRHLHVHRHLARPRRPDRRARPGRPLPDRNPPEPPCASQLI